MIKCDATDKLISEKDQIISEKNEIIEDLLYKMSRMQSSYNTSETFERRKTPKLCIYK